MKRFDYHNHTDMSNIRLVDSINTPKTLVERALSIGLSAIAITEHESLGNAIDIEILQEEVQKEHPDFQIVHGNEIYLVESREPSQPYYHFILLALDATGFQMLSELSSGAWLNGFYDRGMMRVPTLKSEVEAMVQKYGQGHLFASTACLGGELDKLIVEMAMCEKIGNVDGRTQAHDKIVSFLSWCVDTFGKDNVTLEVQPAVSEDQLTVNNLMPSIAAAFDLPICITSDAHYLTKEDQQIHKAFLNSKDGDREVDEFYAACWLQSEDEILEHLRDTNLDYAQCCANSMKILEKVQPYSLRRNQEIPEAPVPETQKKFNELPEYPTLNNLYSSDNPQERYWVNECVDQLKEKNLTDKKYLERLEEEADTMDYIGKQLGTCIFAYPLFMKHYIDLVWECGSTIGCGRGSAGGGLSHYLLGITQTSPFDSHSFFWRFLNKGRVSLPDIDVDVVPNKREKILQETRKETGELGCVHVCTYGVLTTKAAIKCAARGYRSYDYPDGIPLEEAEYLTSLIPSERGFLWTLSDTINGNASKGRKPNKKFIEEVEKYPGLKDILFKIEGLIVQSGIHASGVIYPPKSNYYRYGPFMRAKDGTIVTQYSLHRSEDAGSCKIDWLVTEVQAVITDCIGQLQKAGRIEPELTLRQAYDKYLAPDALPLDDEEIWDEIDKAEILKLFQLNSAVGRQGTKLIKPRNIYELTAVNALIRLMAEDGAERPMDKYVRFKANPQEWDKEMDSYGLSPHEKESMHKHLDTSYGVCYSQEQMMLILMDENICGFDLKAADAARKCVAKKKMNEIPAFKEKVLSSAKSPALGKYVWDVAITPSLGYSFSDVHGYSYSMIGFQCAYLATKFPSVYWNTACLRIDAGINEDASTDYAKLAKAVGNMVAQGVAVKTIDINKSGYLFEPDEKNNAILFGLKALNGISADIIPDIVNNRPYASFENLQEKVKVNKPTMLALIKSGAFDQFESREATMEKYLRQNSDLKKKLTMQNFQALLDNNLVPQELEFERRVYVFNKALRKYKKVGEYYCVNLNFYEFYEQFFNVDELEPYNDTLAISAKKWQKMYTEAMKPAKKYIQEHQEEMLNALNSKLLAAQWEKYAPGNISAWEMDALGFYSHEHELAGINQKAYHIISYKDLPETPEVEYTFKRNGKEIPIFKTCRIMGTVVGKNNTKGQIDILTIDSGVVTVKFKLDYFAKYNRRISDVVDGEKKIVEGSWFNKGTLVVVNGFRRNDTFVERTYKKTPSHGIYRITSINGSYMNMTNARYGEEEG